MTTLYLIRHSKPLKVNNDLNDDDLQIQNEKTCLSIEGEKIAGEIANKKEFENIDVLFSSNYVRAIQTAKYIAEKNNLEIYIVSDLGERKFGINDWSELPSDFERKQFLDENYKIGNGESRKEVCERMLEFINYILDNYKDKRVVLVSHGAAITFLLMNWCELVSASLETKSRHLTFNGKDVINGVMNCPDVFKLEFDGNELIDLKKVYYN